MLENMLFTSSTLHNKIIIREISVSLYTNYNKNMVPEFLCQCSCWDFSLGDLAGTWRGSRLVVIWSVILIISKPKQIIHKEWIALAYNPHNQLHEPKWQPKSYLRLNWLFKGLIIVLLMHSFDLIVLISKQKNLKYFTVDWKIAN